MFAFKESMDTNTAHGRAMLEMAVVFARLEREMIPERVVAGLRRAVAEGKRLGLLPWAMSGTKLGHAPEPVSALQSSRLARWARARSKSRGSLASVSGPFRGSSPRPVSPHQSHVPFKRADRDR